MPQHFTTECIKVPDGNSYVYIPVKLYEYAKNCLPTKPLRDTALDLYMMLARQSSEDTMEFMDKYHNTICNSFTQEKIREFISNSQPSYERVYAAIERYLDGKVYLIEKRVVFQCFLPWVNAYMDPSYILYNLATRRPPAYQVILYTPGGFEIVRNVCLNVRQKYGMMDPRVKPFLLEPHDIQAMRPASEGIKDVPKR
jgi:hypothetical protein